MNLEAGQGRNRMARLLVHVEGQTEETFVNELLLNHLVQKGFDSVSARIVGNSQSRSKRLGIKNWESVIKGITNHLKQDAGWIVSTMVDYYALPSDWPGRANSSQLAHSSKALHVEQELRADVEKVVGLDVASRFVPYVAMHEFEAMLFSDCSSLSRAIGHPELEGRFQTIRDRFSTPEEINDSPTTAPSKRIIGIFPEYEVGKLLFANPAVLEMGLARIRSECPHFDSWITKLESMG